MAGGDTRVFPVIFDKARRVESYGSAHRIFTEGQRLAMIARDQGCSFPRCSVGPNWTEAHHIVNFALGGPTSIENGTMLCGYDHDHHLAAGWSCRMIDGRPHWAPRCGSTRPRHPDATTPTSRSGSTTRDAPCASRRRGYSVTALLSDHVAADQRMCSPTRARDVGVAQERAAVEAVDVAVEVGHIVGIDVVEHQVNLAVGPAPARLVDDHVTPTASGGPERRKAPPKRGFS